MRLSEILLEYKRDITLKNYQSKLEQASNRDQKLPPDEVLVQLEQMDPTKKKLYVQWLVNQYSNGKFRLEDAPRITDVLEKFANAKSRLPQKDINQYDFHSLESEMDKVYNIDLEKEAPESTTGTFPVVPNSKVLYNGPLGQLAIPETQEASCELGKGTKWCTAAKKGNMFDHYAKEAPLYIWRDKNGDKFQFWFGEEMQFMDAQDREISREKLNYFRTKNPITSKLFKANEAEILKSNDPGRAYSYATCVIRGRWPEAEPFIAKAPMYARVYANDILKGRWPEAEPVIAKAPRSAYNYAKDVIKGRWPEAEPVIAKAPRFAYAYARDVIGGRWPEAEPFIAKSSRWAYYYAKDVIKGRWPEAEPVIAKDPQWAYNYARDVIGGRWPEAEAIIAETPDWAYFYARDVIKGRWPEVEPFIKTNENIWKKYCEAFPDAK